MHDRLPAQGARLSRAELDAEMAQPLPHKEVLSLLNLNVDLDLMLDLAAPIDLAVAANANVAAPIDAAVAADVLTVDSISQSMGTQNATIEQTISGEALAEAPQSAVVDQTGGGTSGGTDGGMVAPRSFDVVQPATGDVTDPVGGAVGDVTDPVGDATGDVTGAAGDLTDVVGEAAQDLGGAVTDAVGQLDTSNLLQDGLLNVDVNANLDAALAAPVAGAIAANANVAAPITAAVSANIGAVASEAIAVTDQTAVITQNLDDVVAEAVADQGRRCRAEGQRCAPQHSFDLVADRVGRHRGGAARRQRHELGEDQARAVAEQPLQCGGNADTQHAPRQIGVQPVGCLGKQPHAESSRVEQSHSEHKATETADQCAQSGTGHAEALVRAARAESGGSRGVWWVQKARGAW